MLSTNEQTELEVLQSIETPNIEQQKRIEYLLSKKILKESIKSFKPVDIDSMECKCLNCFLRTIPEHSNDDILVPEIIRYFEYKNKNQKPNSFNNPVVTSMYETVLQEANIFQLGNNLNKDHSNIITIEDVINKYIENRLSHEEKQKIVNNSNFIINVYEACLFIIQEGIKQAEKYNLKCLIAIQTYYMTVELMFSILDKLDYEPSWDLLNLIHLNILKELEYLPNLANLLSNEHLHSNCAPDKPNIIEILKKVLNEL